MDIFGLNTEQWIEIGISLGIVALALLISRPVLTFILDRVVKRITGLSRTILDDKIIQAVRPPLCWLVIALALRTGLDRLEFLPEKFNLDFGDAYFVLNAIIVLAILWRLTDALTEWYLTEIADRTGSANVTQMAPFIRRILLLLLLTVATIVVLGHFEIEVGGLVTTLGIGSLAVALAGQAALADAINGFLIMIDQPFRIGDRIEVQDLNTWGDVVDVGLRSTRIRTRDNRMVIIPNSVIGKSLVVNHSFPDTEYRIQVHVGIGYGTDLEMARRTMVKAVETVPGVQSDRPVDALFLEFGDSALIFRVRWWIESYVDTRVMFDKVNTALYTALEQAGVEMPFPQRDVHHKIDAGDAPRFVEIFNKPENK